MLRAVSGVVPAAANAGLKLQWQRQGYLLACLCRPEGDLELDTCSAARSFDTRIEGTETLSPDVFALWLTRPDGFEFEPGQFVHLTRPHDGLTRPYSIASLASERVIELHVRRAPGGRMSNWLNLQVGSELRVTGPFGECCYSNADPAESILLAGTGTGLAPLLGVLRAALAAGHAGPIRLYHGAHAAHGWYRREELAALAARHPNLTVRLTRNRPAPGASDDADPIPGIERAIGEDLPDLSHQRIYLCGNPGFVHALKRRAYLAGASLNKIHADPFVETSRAERAEAGDAATRDNLVDRVPPA
jgi:ferredoxin-NADP reductase